MLNSSWGKHVFPTPVFLDKQAHILDNKVASPLKKKNKENVKDIISIDEESANEQIKLGQTLNPIG